MKVQIGTQSIWVNYHHLYYFQMIVREGGVARAADKLHLGQSTLSAQIKQFEQALGLKLFERRGRRLQPTEAGLAALTYANEIFRLGTEMVEVLHDKIQPGRVHVSIGALDIIPKHLIVELANAIIAEGNAKVSILEGKGDELLRELEAHKIDLLLTNDRPTSAQGLYARVLTTTPVVICGAPQMIKLRKTFPRSLMGHKFLLPTEHSKLRHDLEHYLRLQEIPLDILAETQDFAVLKLMSVQGQAVVAAPHSAVADSIRKKELVVLGEVPGVSEELFLVAATRRIANPISAKIMQKFGFKV